MWPKYSLFLLYVFALLNLSSCSRSRGYFSNHVLEENLEIKHQVPVLLASDSENPFILQVTDEATAKLEARHEKTEVEKYVSVANLNLASKRDLKKQNKAFQKEVISTIKKFKVQNKIAEKKSSSNHWEPRLKIGLTLLVIGILLSIFGLGLIGGISAFIGLLFTILGLLNTYY